MAPDYPTASEIWRDLKRATRGAWVHKDETERRVELTSGGSITVKSAHHPDSLVGVGLDGVVIDEAGKTDGAAWSESLRPTLSDRNGWAVFIGTPKGHNWFWELFQHAGRTEGWERWQRPTSDNPLVPAAELEAARLDAPAHFGQEYEARFVAVEGAEWPPEYLDWPGLWFTDWPDLGQLTIRVMALDPSKGADAGKSDWQALILHGRDRHGVEWVEADLDRRPIVAPRAPDGTPTGEGMVEAVVERAQWFRPHSLGFEANQFQLLLRLPLLEEMRRRRVSDVPLHLIDNRDPKILRIRRLGAPLGERRLRIRDTRGGRLLCQQLRDFPAGEFDDGPDALEQARRLSIHMFNEGYDRQPGISQA